jgi:hypothetical protein
MLKLLHKTYIAGRRERNGRKMHSHDGTANYPCASPSFHYNISFTRHHSQSLDSSCRVTISVLQDCMLGDKCLGKVDTDLERLLERQNLQINEGEYYLILLIWML